MTFPNSIPSSFRPYLTLAWDVVKTFLLCALVFAGFAACAMIFTMQHNMCISCR